MAAAAAGAREEQAERYEEMVEFMEKVVAATAASEFTVEERNLLFVAYKNVINVCRAPWRIVSSIEHKEESRGAAGHAVAARGYRARVENELSGICAAAVDAKVFCLDELCAQPLVGFLGRLGAPPRRAQL